MPYILLITAFALSSIAAYYSIVGLIAIFAAAPYSIALMGGILEVSKIVVTSWLYRNWNTAPAALKSYFIVAVIILMLITSMGIFGALSKSHADQTLVSGDAIAQVAMFDEKIKIEKENIDVLRKTLSQLDSQVDATLGRSTSEAGATRSSNLRKSQAKEREQIQKTILSSQESIRKLSEERAPIATEARQAEAEVGPIRYIAALIYGDNPDSNVLEKSVRIVILLIVFVFDPLAVLMFIAFNMTIARSRSSAAEAICPNGNPLATIIPDFNENLTQKDVNKQSVEDDQNSKTVIDLHETDSEGFEIDLIEPKEPKQEIAELDSSVTLDQLRSKRAPKFKNKPVEWERDRKLDKI